MRGPRSNVHWLALLLVCAGLSPVGCEQASAEHAAPSVQEETAPVAVQVVAAKSKIRPITLTLDGTLVADEESDVTSVVTGRVVQVLVERGSKVEAKAPLVKLRDVDYRLQAQAARAQLEQARARLGMASGDAPPEPEKLPEVEAARTELVLAEQDLARMEELAKANALAPSQLDSARARAQGARNRYENAKNQAQAAVAALDVARVSLNQAKTAQAETIVRAPFAGEIANRMVNVGEFVAPQSPLVTLVRIDPLRIELLVPQQHLRSVQPGQKVSLTVDAIPGEVFEAEVRYVSASVARSTRALAVEAIVPNPDGKLRPGLFATARLETGGESEVAVIPTSAVRTVAGVSRVFVIKDGAVVERVVSLAGEDGEDVIVGEGVEPGELVAIEKLDELSDGRKATATEEGGEKAVAAADEEAVEQDAPVAEGKE